MTTNTDTAMPSLLLGEAGGDPIGDRLRETVRATVEALFDEELAASGTAGARARTARPPNGARRRRRATSG